jgi:hypothetical protein
MWRLGARNWMRSVAVQRSSSLHFGYTPRTRTHINSLLEALLLPLERCILLLQMVNPPLNPIKPRIGRTVDMWALQILWEGKPSWLQGQPGRFRSGETSRSRPISTR